MSIDSALEVLHKYWGYPAFRGGQEAAVSSILAGNDTLVVMPTGGGKSLCYQVPAMLLPGVTLVVSPLISLMKDQVDALDAVGIPATFINSSLSSAEMNARLEMIDSGAAKLVYVAPERFDSTAFRERLARLRVSLLAVDEAHCVSQWGHDFRPSYLRIGEVRRALGDPPVAALTATATEEVRRDIQKQLRLRDARVLVSGFDRRNLTWHVLRAKNDSEKDRTLLRLLRGQEGSAIVYANTRKNVDALTALLTGVGMRAVGYHAGLNDGDRKRLQDSFMSGAARLVVATNAFGMGIDKPDVRLVVHYNMPGSLEAYYQEGGRAGRDGGPADCVLLHAYPDRFTHEFFIEQTYPPRPLIEELMRELRARGDQDGVVSNPISELARSLRSGKGDRQAFSALRILEDHELVRSLAGSGASAARVRLIASPKRISRELDVPGREAEITFLRRLWRVAGGKRAYRGFDIEWLGLGGMGGGRDQATALLEKLEREGVLEWHRGVDGAGIQVLDASTDSRRLPIDWRGLDDRKNRELGKLRRMQDYAYTERCRRGLVLRYFGDPEAMESCGACDNCLGGSPFAPPASSRSATSSDATPKVRSRGGAVKAPRAAPRPKIELGPESAERFQRLRALRSRLAREASLPAYCIFSDRTLTELAARRPGTEHELLDIPGIGPAKVEKYGVAFLEALRT